MMIRYGTDETDGGIFRVFVSSFQTRLVNKNLEISGTWMFFNGTLESWESGPLGQGRHDSPCVPVQMLFYRFTVPPHSNMHCMLPFFWWVFVGSLTTWNLGFCCMILPLLADHFLRYRGIGPIWDQPIAPGLIFTPPNWVEPSRWSWRSAVKTPVPLWTSTW